MFICHCSSLQSAFVTQRICALINDISVIKNDGKHHTGKKTFKLQVMLISFSKTSVIIIQRSFSIFAFIPVVSWVVNT